MGKSLLVLIYFLFMVILSIVSALQEAMNMSKFVVIGYGTQKISDHTGAVTTVSAHKFNRSMAFSPEQLHKDITAGLQITSSKGEPGNSSGIRKSVYEPFRNLFPIPSQQIGANPNLIQNLG